MFVFWQNLEGSWIKKKKNIKPQHAPMLYILFLYPILPLLLLRSLDWTTKFLIFFLLWIQGGRNQYSEADGYRM